MTIPTLSGKTVLITGANTGLGLELSVLAANDGARVVMACRNPEKAAKAKAIVLQRADGVPEDRIVLVTLDLASLASVKSFRERYTEPNLDVLMCNAGIMMPPYSKTEDGFESQFATNVLGHYALIQVVYDLLARSDYARLVITSSIMASFAKGVNLEDINREKGYNATRVYSETKLCDLLLTHKFNRVMKEKEGKVVAVACHPGYTATDLQRSVAGGSIANFLFAQSAPQGALPSYWAASQAEVTPGDYCGPNGWFEIRGKPKWGCRQNKKAKDEALQDALWKKCEEMSGLVLTP